MGLMLVASRVHLGVHYPTDVMAGWTAGLARSLVCWLVARAVQWRGAKRRQFRFTSGAKGATRANGRRVAARP